MENIEDRLLSIESLGCCNVHINGREGTRQKRHAYHPFLRTTSGGVQMMHGS